MGERKSSIQKSSENRDRVVAFIRQASGEVSVAAIVARTGLRSSTVYPILNYLRDREMILVDRHGDERVKGGGTVPHLVRWNHGRSE